MQQVNLYRGALLPKPEVLPLSAINLSIALGLFISVIVWFVSWNTQNTLQHQYSKQISQINRLSSQLEQLQNMIPAADVEAKAIASINNLQNQLIRRQKIAALINEMNENNGKGFSPIFNDLSQISNKDLWFTRIFVKSNQINLEGETLESASVANMVLQLQSFNNTSGVKFKTVSIAREKKHHNISKFILYSNPEELQNGI